MSSPTKSEILKILSGIEDPAAPAGGARDIVSRNMVAGITVKEGAVTFAIAVDPARGAALEPLRQQAQAAVEKLAGVTSVQAVLTAERARPPAFHGKGAPHSSRGPAMTMGGHRISSNPVAPAVRHIVAVASGKGGVGKSTVAANVALAFAALGKSTGLLDADIYGASQPVMMGVNVKPEVNDKDLIVPPTAHGLKVMSMGFFVEKAAPIIWRGPLVHSAVQQLFRDVDWGALDVLVVDLPPGTGDAHLSVAQYVPVSGAIIVSTPQDVALNEAIKGLRMFGKTSVPILGIVENMSYHVCEGCGRREEIFGHGGARAAAARENVPFLGEIPLETAVRDKGDAGTPIVAALPHHKVSEAFMNIAARIWAALPERRPEKALLQRTQS